VPSQTPAGVPWPDWQEPALQIVPDAKVSTGHAASVPLQVSAGSHGPALSRHSAPALPGAVTQPRTESQLSTVQGFVSLQARDAPPWQVPPLQTSLVVQALLSLHERVLLAKTQPVEELHESSVHGLASSQVLGLERHEPPWHRSPVVQASPSVHVFVSSLECAQPVRGLQVSSVHALPSSQLVGALTQAPAEHRSPVVQALLSLQVFVSSFA